MADPKTDWSKVDIDALRRHLVDMNNVTLFANVASTPIDGGMRFDVTGEVGVRDSIRRMVSAHAATMNSRDGWTFEAEDIEGGASLAVRRPQPAAPKITPTAAVRITTTSGGARQTTSAANPAAAIAKSAGFKTALVHTGL